MTKQTTEQTLATLAEVDSVQFCEVDLDPTLYPQSAVTAAIAEASARGLATFTQRGHYVTVIPVSQQSMRAAIGDFLGLLLSHSVATTT